MFYTKKIFYSLVFLGSILASGLQAQTSEIKKVSLSQPVKIVIDAGHGGKDNGKPRSAKDKLHEKEINLIIALKVKNYLTERVENLTVILTRQDDSKVSLDERVQIANDNKADYFVSLHCNSVPQHYVEGVELHIQNHRFQLSKGLAKSLEHQFVKRTGRKSLGILARNDRGFNYQVLQYTDMPGVLLELGFLSNETEELFLNSERGQDLLASAIFRGIRDFLVENPSPKPEARFPYYRIQIAASSLNEDLKGEKFASLNMKIDEVKQKDGSFIYLVGREYEKSVINQLLKKVQKKDFKDAFIINIDK